MSLRNVYKISDLAISSKNITGIKVRNFEQVSQILIVNTVQKILGKLQIEKKSEDEKSRPLLSVNQINFLIGMTYTKSGKLILSLDDPDTLMEILAMLKDSGYESVINYYNTKPDDEEFIWQQPALKEVRINAKMSKDSSAQKGQILNIECRRKTCGSNEISFSQKQVRGPDEPETSFFRCIHCDFSWRS
jgi:DNA-directed RNA polymerase subunit M/transcription elongation factor TFIIS